MNMMEAFQDLPFAPLHCSLLNAAEKRAGAEACLGRDNWISCFREAPSSGLGAGGRTETKNNLTTK